MSIASQKLLIAKRRGLLAQPFANRRFVKMDEYAFSKLLDRGQPVRVARDRRAANAQLNVFNIAISCRGRSFKSRESVEAGHLSQAMNSDEVLDRGEVDLSVRIFPNTRGRASGRKALRSDGWRRSPAVHWRTYRTRTAWETG